MGRVLNRALYTNDIALASDIASASAIAIAIATAQGMAGNCLRLKVANQEPKPRTYCTEYRTYVRTYAVA